MKEREILRGKRLLRDYAAAKRRHKKERVRDELFEILYPWEVRWIKSLLGRKYKGVEEGEIISLSWDCFLYSLDHYKIHLEDEIPFFKHFFNYTRYYLLDHWRKEDSEKSREIDDEHIEEIATESEGIFYLEYFDFLKKFRESLPESYRIVLEDALLSLIPYRPLRQRRVEESKLSRYRYDEAKKVFNFVLSFLLKQKL